MKRGFSLIEALLTLSLVGLVLTLTAQTVREYSGVLRAAGQRDQTFECCALLQRMARELEGAVQIAVPGPSGTASELRFWRYRHPSERLPDDPLSAPASWSVREPADLEEIHYTFASEQLQRSTDGGPGQPLVGSVAGFSCQDQGQNLRLRVSVNEGQRLEPLEAVVFLPLRRQP